MSWRQDGRAAPTRLQTEKPPEGLFVFWVGLGAHFCLQRPLRAAKGIRTVTGMLRERLIALVEPVLERLGYELVDLEFAAGRARTRWCDSL